MNLKISMNIKLYAVRRIIPAYMDTDLHQRYQIELKPIRIFDTKAIFDSLPIPEKKKFLPKLLKISKMATQYPD